MDKIVSLGTAACNLARAIKKQAPSIYEVYQIDQDCTGDDCFSLPKYSEWDDYDQKDLGDYESFLSGVEGEKLFITSCGTVSGASLKIIKALGPEDTTVLYIAPDITVANEETKVRNRVVSGVLQEYARSGAIKEMMVLDNRMADAYCPSLTISNYLDGINDYMASIVHWNNIFEHTTPIVEGSKWSKFSKISTLGISEVSLDEEKIVTKECLLSEQDGNIEKHYMFAIPEEILNEKAGLHRQIKEFTSSEQRPGLSTTFSVYSTKQDRAFCIIVQKSRDIQKNT